MRILNQKQFLALPEGVAYSEYKTSGMVHGLYEKGKSFANDWIYCDLLSEVDANDSADYHELYEQAEKGMEFRLVHDVGSRDGAFDEDAMFMVYDNEDVLALIAKLTSLVRSGSTESD